MRDIGIKIQKRYQIFLLLMIGILAVLLLRVGYMQFFYQENVVTFAQLDQNASNQNAKMLNEVKNEFNVNLAQFREVYIDELYYSGRTNDETLSLVDLVYTSCKKGCVGQPGIFVNDKTGFVFMKNRNGKSVLQEIRKERGRWGIISTKISE